MPSTTDKERPPLYLGPENEQEWSRLHRAIELTEGFALYLISVHDFATTAELIRRLQHGFPDRTTHTVTVTDQTPPEVAALLQGIAPLPSETLVILTGLQGQKKLPADFWRRFNERRNLWQRHSPCVHLWFIDSHIRQQILTQAPDMYSIRSPDFLFTLPPSAQERFAERPTASTPFWPETADDLLAEADAFAEDQTPTGRVLYGRALVAIAQRLQFEHRLDETRQVIKRGLALTQEQPLPELQAAFLLALGSLDHRLDQLSSARSHYEEALTLYRQEKNILGEANTLQALGDLKVRLADLAGARTDYEAALSLYRTIQARLGEANTRKALGDLKVRLDDLAGARTDYEAALPLYRTIQARLGEANTLQALGDLKVRLADLAGARTDYEAALPLSRTIQDRLGEANTLQALGALLAAEEHFEEAVEETHAAFAIHCEIHALPNCAADLVILGRVMQRAGRHEYAILCLEEALLLSRTVNSFFNQALALQDQGQSLGTLELYNGALAALWQAREIFRAIQDPSATERDTLFAQLEQNDPENFPQLLADLQTRAEELRQEAVAKVRETVGEDPLLQQINAAVRALPASAEQPS
jgi:tetratricopeptide (TPR) repeat protein